MFVRYSWESCPFLKEKEEMWIWNRENGEDLGGEEGGGNSGWDIMHERILTLMK